MNRLILYCALCLIVFLGFASCEQEKAALPNNSGNLFSATEDTLLFKAKVQTDLSLPEDSAYSISSIVAAGRPLFIDSTIRGGQKAPFYLVCTTIDTVLKGQLPLRKKLYFAATVLPAFPLNSTNQWVIYLSRIDKGARLLSYNLQWQWTINAPVHKYVAPVKDTAAPKQRIIRRRHRYRKYKIHHLK